MDCDRAVPWTVGRRHGLQQGSIGIVAREVATVLHSDDHAFRLTPIRRADTPLRPLRPHHAHAPLKSHTPPTQPAHAPHWSPTPISRARPATWGRPARA